MATQTNFNTVPAHGVAVMIHRDHVGFVIGPKYKAVNNVARQTKTRIQVNDDNKMAAFVKFVIGGRSVEDIQKAHQMLLEIASRAEAATPRVGMNPPNNMFRPFPMGAIEHRVHVAPEDVGMVLGAKGSTLRKMASDTWTWIKFLKGTDQVPPTFSIRGFLQSDVGEATKRVLGIAQESFNRRSGGPRHHRAPVTMMEAAGTFTLAPVPQSKRVSFKVKEPVSPKYTPHSPTYPPPHSPTYPPPHSPADGPHTPRTPPSA